MPHNTQWNIQMSEESTRIVNPIRNVSDNAPKSKSEKPLIALSIGDPTIDGNLLTPPTHIEAIKRVAECHKYDGYAPSAGYADTRQAVAEYWRKEFTAPERQHEILGENVFMTSGGAHAIQFAIQALCNPGDNVLIPAPGYSHYETVCQYAQIEPRFYELKQDENWECNLKHIEELTDERTKLFIMTNPSNPCGSNFSKQHVEDVVRLAEKLHVVMLADEIYAGMVFQHDENPSKEFYSVANVETQCPRVILGGTAKMYVVPGWRIAWLLVIDPANLAGEYKKALMKQTMLIVGPCTLSQGALRSCLLETPRSYYTECVGEIERSAVGFYKYLNSRASLMGPDNQPMQMLEAMLPQGALYVMMRINFKNFKKEIHNDQVFFERLLEEENVQVMPGNAFHAPGFCRIVITRRLATLQEATDRIVAFCERYKRIH